MAFIMQTSIVLLLVLVSSFSYSQKVKPRKYATLSKDIKECSGLAIWWKGQLCCIQDGKNRNLIYILQTTHGSCDTFRLNEKIKNIDWEDLTTDDSGNLYIGDFGNNLQMRQNLKIYKLAASPVSEYKESENYPPTQNFQEISFQYPDQKKFPPPPENWNFDCEAFFHYKDFLYIFTKNTSAHYGSGYTKMYRLPDTPGNYIAELIDSFFTNEPITSADISPDGKTVALLSYFSIWVFKDFSTDSFFKGKYFQLPIKGFTQKEALIFPFDKASYKSNTELEDTVYGNWLHDLLWIADERRYIFGGNVYKIYLDQLNFSESTLKYKKQNLKRVLYNAFNNPKAKYKRIIRNNYIP